MPDLALDLRYLKYALLVAEHGSFRRAAAMLNLSQSTVSRRIQYLERRIGAPLFERSRTGVRTTIAGERFMREAAVGAEQLHQAVDNLGTLRRDGAGELKIGLMASLAGGFLSDLLGSFRQDFPHVEVRVEEAAWQVNVASVLAGRLDAAFVTGSPALAGCESEYLWEEQVFVALPEAHDLMGRTAIGWEEIRNEVFLVGVEGPGPEIKDCIIRQLSGTGFRPSISVQKVGRENLMNMVAKGFGLTLTTDSTLGASYPGVAFVPIGPPTEMVASSVVWSPSNCNPALKRLLDMGGRLATKRRRAAARQRGANMG
jgi:DNA-binding transcriptional LysR family regulator